jgi:hypothetical protein
MHFGSRRSRTWRAVPTQHGLKALQAKRQRGEREEKSVWEGRSAGGSGTWAASRAGESASHLWCCCKVNPAAPSILIGCRRGWAVDGSLDRGTAGRAAPTADEVDPAENWSPPTKRSGLDAARLCAGPLPVRGSTALRALVALVASLPPVESRLLSFLQPPGSPATGPAAAWSGFVRRPLVARRPHEPARTILADQTLQVRNGSRPSRKPGLTGCGESSGGSGGSMALRHVGDRQRFLAQAPPPSGRRRGDRTLISQAASPSQPPIPPKLSLPSLCPPFLSTLLSSSNSPTFPTNSGRTRR